MTVYMAGQGWGHPVKIGWSTFPGNRLAGLQGSHWMEIKLLRAFKGARVEERQLHRLFAARHLRGEWFSYCDEMRGDVGLEELAETDWPRRLSLPDDPPMPGMDRKIWKQVYRIWTREHASGQHGEPSALALYYRVMSEISAEKLR